MRYEKKNQIGTIGHQSPNLYAENFAFVFRLNNKKKATMQLVSMKNIPNFRQILEEVK